MENTLEKFLNEQTALIEKLRETVNSLHEKLKPVIVLGDLTAAGMVESSAPIMSPLAEIIKGHNDGICSSIENLLCIIKNVDL